MMGGAPDSEENHTGEKTSGHDKSGDDNASDEGQASHPTDSPDYQQP
jgi:hypothetical protein